MIYLDTSAVMPLFITESSSSRVRAQVAPIESGRAALSEWTLLEFGGAIGARVRAGSLSQEEGAEVIRTLDEVAALSFVLLMPEQVDFDLARSWVGNFQIGLRGGDALHLAIASRTAATLFTLDGA